jgi:hypothetical protein
LAHIDNLEFKRAPHEPVSPSASVPSATTCSTATTPTNPPPNHSPSPPHDEQLLDYSSPKNKTTPRSSQESDHANNQTDKKLSYRDVLTSSSPSLHKLRCAQDLPEEDSTTAPPPPLRPKLRSILVRPEVVSLPPSPRPHTRYLVDASMKVLGREANHP